MFEWIKKVLTKIKDWIMANYATLKAAIADVIKTNGNEEITGEILQNAIIALIESLGAKYQFAGIATPGSSGTNPGTPDYNVMYIAGAGTYPNFGGTVVPRGSVGVFRYNGEWIYSVLDVASWADASNKLYYNTQAGNVAAKTIQADGFTLQPGGWIKVHFNNANEAANPTLNVNNTGAHAMTFNGALVSKTNSWKTGETIAFYYDNYSVGIWHGIRLVEYPDFINVNELVGQNTPFASASGARSAIPQQNRKAGLNIAYLLSTGEETSQWQLDMFIGDDVTDWGVADNWKTIGPVSVSQNTLTIGGNYAGEMSTTYDVTLHNNGATFASLEALLSDANLSTLIPANVRKGGMSIKFVQSSDNKYVQVRYMGTSIANADFTNVDNWQGVDDKPTPGSKNFSESGGIANRGLTGFPLKGIASQIGASGVTATGQYYFNTTRKKVVYINRYIDQSHADTVDIDPIDGALYTVGTEIYVYDATNEVMAPYALKNTNDDNRVAKVGAIKTLINKSIAEQAKILNISVPTTEVTPPSGETDTEFNPYAFPFKNGESYRVEVTNNSEFVCVVRLASSVAGSENIVQEIGNVSAGESMIFEFTCNSDSAYYIWFRYQSSVDQTLVYSFDASIRFVEQQKFASGEVLKNVSIDSDVIPGNTGLAKSGSAAKRGLTGFPLKGIASQIGASGVTATGQYYFNTTHKKVVYIKNYIDQSHADTVDIDPIDGALYTVGTELYVYDAVNEAMVFITKLLQNSIIIDADQDEVPSSVISSALRDIELGVSCDVSDFDYVLIKDSNSYTREEDANGTRLRLIMKVTKPCVLSINSSYNYFCNIYNHVDNAILATSQQSVIEELITGLSYITGPFTKNTTKSGYLSLSLKKSDNSVISQQDKEDMLSNLKFRIYTPDGLYDLINKREEGEWLNTELSAPIVNISADLRSRSKDISSQSLNVIYCGKNLLNASTLIRNKILNDNGEEVSDGSSYYAQKIPCHGMTLKSNWGMQRIYRYDENNNFLGRESANANRREYVVPSDTYFVQIQVQNISETTCVIFDNGKDTTDYEVFSISNDIPLEGTINAFIDGIEDVDIDLSIRCKYIIPAVKEYDFWEPDNVTDDYKCTHLGQYDQSIPALTDTLKYKGFLATYYDIYIGNYDNGYSVTKEELGLDSGAVVEQAENPVFSYTFAPKYYNKTVLLSAGMNTCEASTYFGLAYFIKALMEHTEPGMLALYNSTRFVVIPVICPTGISHDPLLYRNANNVRINKNFSFDGSWKYNYDRLEQEGKNQYPGPYPDSEVETKLLKAWMNRYAGSTFYMDCHSDTGGTASQVTSLTVCFCSDDTTRQKLQYRKNIIEQFYRDKGYIPTGVTPTLTFGGAGLTYPKTPYSWSILRTPAMMHEQYIRSTMYGSDGQTNNDDYGIKNYVALIRWYVLIMCKSNAEIVF